MTRGYRNYRGRRSWGKPLLAALLILVILLSVGFLILQERVLFFDETGTPYVRLPGQSVEEEAPPETIDLTIEPSELPAERRTLRGFLVPSPLETESWSQSAQQAQETLGADAAVAVTLKDAAGTVCFDSAAALPGTVRVSAGETDVVLADILAGPSGTIARISCFHDPKAANRETASMGLQNTGGYIFYDANNSQWLDPGKETARAYLLEIIREAETLGFDEILLTDVSYPTEGKLNKITYTGLDGAPAEEICRVQLAAFLREVRAALKPETILSLELDADTVRSGENEAAGQVLAELAPLVDCIYAQTAEAEIPELEAAVKAAAETCDFVPELERYSDAVTGSCLIF